MFKVESSKNCVRYTKRTYSFDCEVDESFVDHFSVFGAPEITDVKKYLPNANNFLKIRNYDYSFELSCGMNSEKIMVIYKLNDKEVMTLVEEELGNWISCQRG